MPTSKRPPLDTGDAAPPLPDVLQFLQLLWAVVHGLEKVSKRMTGTIGVTGPQRLALRVVGLYPGLSAGDLATVLHLHPSTLTGVLQRLVAQRLLQRVEDPADRRRAILRLTALGARVNARSQGTAESLVRAALTGIRPHDRTAARRVLARLAQSLDRPSSGGSDSAPRPGARRRRPGPRR
jgi:DNA-binding MarR family transcriptional regulator